MITTITLKYTFPLTGTMSYANQKTEAENVPLDIAPFVDAFPLLIRTDTTVINGPNLERTLVYDPIQPQFDSLFLTPPDAAAATGLVSNLWTMTLAQKLCTLVKEVVTVLLWLGALPQR